MHEADEILDIGPKAGRHGGQIVYQGDYDGLVASDSETGEYLSGKKRIELPKNTRQPEEYLKLE